MSAQAVTLARKWVPMPGGSCNVRMGYDAIEHSSKVFKAAVGKPLRCLVVIGEGHDDELRESLRRTIVDAGFLVSWYVVENGPTRTIESALKLTEACGEVGLTSGDLCCVLGDSDLISLVSSVAGTWCGGVSIMAIPTDEVCLFEGVLMPTSLDVGALPRMVAVRPCVRNVLLDYDLMLSDVNSDSSRHTRALMVAAAMMTSEREFSALWDRADAIMAEDESAFVDQLLASAKSWGQTASSTAAAIRQSIDYGRDFAWAVQGLTDAVLPTAELLAEGMRFSARLSVMLDKLSLDDMLAQDELLETLGLGTLGVSVDAQGLFDAIRRERFLRTNRIMMLLPHAIGRVRLTTVEDALLLENLEAWCDVHRAE